MADAAEAATIAVFDPDPSLLRLLELALSDEGYTVVTSLVGPILETITLLETHRPRLVIYDIAPPYVQSRDDLERVQRAVRDWDCRFVLMTTNRLALEQELGRVDVCDVVDKPFNLDTVLAAVHRCLGDDR
jgi:DNA-binding NtrC family response regulator